MLKCFRRFFSSKSTDKPQHDTNPEPDRFSSVWGGSTQIKYAKDRGQRFRPVTAIPDPMFHTTLAMPVQQASMQPRSTSQDSVDLNKPLPSAPMQPRSMHRNLIDLNKPLPPLPQSEEEQPSAQDMSIQRASISDKKAASDSSKESGSTLDTIGTYESRYSDHPGDEQRKSYFPSLKRPLPMPFNKLPSFSGTTPGARRASWHKLSVNRSRSSGAASGTSTPSPLRHAIDTPSSTRQHDSAPSDLFRMPVFNQPLSPFEPAPCMAVDIPDHFNGSPLCPLHPKNKGYGVLTCPAHGPPKFLVLTGSDDSGKGSASSGSTPEKDSPDGEAQTPSTFRREFWDGAEERRDLSFRLNMDEHDEDSLLCPAHPRNAGGKGVCVYHGRGSRPAAGWGGRDRDSEDSVMRFRQVS